MNPASQMSRWAAASCLEVAEAIVQEWLDHGVLASLGAEDVASLRIQRAESAHWLYEKDDDA